MKANRETEQPRYGFGIRSNGQDRIGRGEFRAVREKEMVQRP